MTSALASNQTTDAIKQTVISLTTSPSAPPVANAGSAQSVVAGSTVTLDASTSTAATGKTLTYAWTLTAKPAGSAATLAAPTTAKPTFVADVAGSYVASVIVNDGQVSSAPANSTVIAVERIVGALGIATVQFSVSSWCNVNGPLGIGLWTWTVSNCQVFGNAGAPLYARIQNNGSTALTLTKIHILAGYFGNAWNINPASQTIQPGSTVDFALPLWMGLEVTNAVATFYLTGEQDLVVQLSGNMTLP